MAERVNVNFIDDADVACIDELSERDGKSGRQAVIRKAVRRLAEDELGAERVSEIREQVATRAA